MKPERVYNREGEWSATWWRFKGLMVGKNRSFRGDGKTAPNWLMMWRNWSLELSHKDYK